MVWYIIGGILAYLFIAHLSYRLIKNDILNFTKRYTRGDRNMVVFLSLFQPVGIIIGLTVLFSPTGDRDEILETREGDEGEDWD